MLYRKAPHSTGTQRWTQDVTQLSMFLLNIGAKAHPHLHCLYSRHHVHSRHHLPSRQHADIHQSAPRQTPRC
jgi:hypothetical protein